MSFSEILKTPGIPAVLFTQFMLAFGFGVILPILPFYTLSLGAKPFELGLLTATFAFMSLLSNPFFGKLSDKIGRKKVLFMGVSGFLAAYLLFAFSDSLLLAFVARAIEGIAAGAVFPCCLSLLSDLTTEKQRGKAMGLFSMTFSLGFILGPAVGGIASAISVKDVFFVSAGFSIINLCWIHFRLKEPHEKQESKDLTAQEVTLLERISSPLLFLFLSSFMITFIIGGLDATLALHTSAVLGFTSAQVGLVFTYIGFLILVMQLVSGSLVNRFGELNLIRVGLVFSGLGFFLLQYANDWPGLLFPLAVLVAGNALVFPSVSSLLTKKVTAKRGAVLGLAGSFNSSGQIVGPLLAGFLYGMVPAWAFWGMTFVIFSYALFFSAYAVPRLETKA